MWSVKSARHKTLCYLAFLKALHILCDSFMSLRITIWDEVGGTGRLAILQREPTHFSPATQNVEEVLYT